MAGCGNQDAMDRIKRLARKEPLVQSLGTRLKFLSADINISSFGSDSVNTTLLATAKDEEDNAVIIKCANRYTNTSGAVSQMPSSWLQKEYDAISVAYSKIPCLVPEPLFYDKDEQIVLLEHCKDYQVLWAELQEGRVDEVALQQLAKGLADLHHATHTTQVSSDVRPHQDLINEEMAKLQKDLVFVKPYDSCSPSVKVAMEMQPYLTRVHGDSRLKAAVDRAKSVYEDKRESLIHGDLHLANVIVNQGHAKLTNFTFSRTGPRSFDLGLLLAGYMTMYHFHMLIPENNDDHRQVSYKMMDACRSTVETYLSQLVSSGESDQGPEDFFSETAGFVGCELVRRAIGVDPYLGTETRPEVLIEMLESGLRLLKAHHPITDVGRLLMIGLALC